MISTFDLLLLSIALAMDCFTVSMMSGVMLRRSINAAILRMALLFGVFQAAMPLAGWIGTAHFSQYLEAVDHWIAFGLLVFIGGKMIKESFDDNGEPSFNPLHFRTQLLLAVATSIDALAVGISMACLGYSHITMLAEPLLMIGVASLVLSVVGYWLGVRFGRIVHGGCAPNSWAGWCLCSSASRYYCLTY